MAAEASVSAIAPAAPARSGRFALNLASNLAKLGLTMLIGAWYVPFLIRQLGPAAYGMIPLASMITSYMALITFGMEAAMARSMAISLERKDYRHANVVFNVALWGNLALVCMLAIPAATIVLNVEHLIRIPPGYETATRWVFAGTVAAFLLNQIRAPFAASCFCLNRLDLQNVLIVGETLTRVGLVVLLFLVVAPRIEFVGLGILAGTAASTLVAVWLWRELTPDLRVRVRDFDWATLKGLISTGGWVIVNQIGVLLFVNIDLVLANRLFGPKESGRYAAVLIVPTLLRTMSTAVGEIFAPTMFQMYARGETAALEAYLKRAIKFVGLVMALGIGLICGFSRPLLTLWLGPDFGDLSSLLVLMAAPLCIGLSMYPLFAVPLAADRVKVPGVVTLVVGLINVGLVFLLARFLGWGLYGIAAAGGISLTLRHLLFTPFYGAAVLKRPYTTFFRPVVPIVLATFATIGSCRLLQLGWNFSSWMDLATAAMAVSALYAASICLLLSSEERSALKEIIVRWRN